MKQRTWIYTAAGTVVAGALLAWSFAPRPVEVEVATATKGHFETTIDEDGKTRLRDRYVVSAPLAGVLTRITLREGDHVDAGAVVATLAPVLSPMLDERTLREQQVRVEIATAQVQRANARIERAKVALLQAANEARRSGQLAGQGFVSPTKLETDRLAALAAQKDLDAAVEERHVAGRVLRVAQTSEMTVPLGTPLVELGETARLEVVAELLTTDALQAAAGSAVVIERWGGSGTLGMAVFVLESGRARMVPVEVAARNGSDAWVRRGIAPGTRVIVYPPAAVADGVRVRERQVSAAR